LTPDTDIVISVRGTAQFPIERDFERCVETITQHTARYRFIFVDDNSEDEARLTIERVARQFPTALLLRTHTQNWFTKAYNKGLRLVRSSRAVVLNADTVVDAGWLDELYAVWDEAAVSGPVGLVGSVQSADEQRRWASIQTPGYVTGHCLLVSMEAIFKASESRGMPGWYLNETDYRHAHIHSDTELSHTLHRLGYQTIASFKAAVGHIGFRSWGGNLAYIYVVTPEVMAKIDGY